MRAQAKRVCSDKVFGHSAPIESFAAQIHQPVAALKRNSFVLIDNKRGDSRIRLAAKVDTSCIRLGVQDENHATRPLSSRPTGELFSKVTGETVKNGRDSGCLGAP